MTIGVSLILIAVGAILVWGVTGEVSGLDVDAIGVILMVVGLIGAVLSLIFWSSWSPIHRRRAAYVADEDLSEISEDEYVERRRRPAARRHVVVEEDVPPPGPPPP